MRYLINICLFLQNIRMTALRQWNAEKFRGNKFGRVGLFSCLDSQKISDVQIKKQSRSKATGWGRRKMKARKNWKQQKERWRPPGINRKKRKKQFWKREPLAMATEKQMKSVQRMMRPHTTGWRIVDRKKESTTREWSQSSKNKREKRKTVAACELEKDENERRE